jgi:hypothetical protein
VRLIWLDPRNEEELRWHRDPEELATDAQATRYIDGDGFNEINIIAVEDGMAGEIVTTVLFAGSPVLVIRSGDVPLAQPPNISPVWSYELPIFINDREADAQAAAAFMVAIGEFDEETPAFVAERGLGALDDDDAPPRGDGHELTAFVDMVARAVHREWPDDTPPTQDQELEQPSHEQFGGRGGEI